MESSKTTAITLSIGSFFLFCIGFQSLTLTLGQIVGILSCYGLYTLIKPLFKKAKS